jgi:hypothetical protein
MPILGMLNTYEHSITINFLRPFFVCETDSYHFAKADLKPLNLL